VSVAAASPSSTPSLQTFRPSPTPTVLELNREAVIDNLVNPEAAVAGFGSIWIPNHRGGSLTRVEPATNQATEIELGVSRTNNIVVFGAGSVWIGVWTEPDTGMDWLRIDPTSNTIVGKVRVLGRGAFGAGRLWIHDAGRLSVLDPRHNKVAQTVTVTEYDDETGVAYGDKAVWVATSRHGLFRVSPKTLKTLARIDDVSAWKVFSDGKEVWTVDEANGTITRIDTRRNAVDVTLQTRGAVFGRIVGETLVVQGGEWLTIVDIPTVSIVAEYQLREGEGGGYPEIAFGSLWVPNFEGTTVARIRWPLK